MIKFLKKIKPKHLARFGLVLMLGCYLSLFLCSAALVIYSCIVCRCHEKMSLVRSGACSLMQNSAT